MYLKNLYIRDFGIFNNQHLQQLSKNIVLIGGKNRAGKSTFLKVLRFLAYGLPQDGSIPPAKNQYYLEADLVTKTGKGYNLNLTGFARPEIFTENGVKAELENIYNGLDQLSYQQLFTITLDELQQLDKVVKGKKTRKRLYSILLGAGLSELTKVPSLADKYFKTAQNIGGKLGDPSVANFKPYYHAIKAAQKKKQTALQEINTFQEKQQLLTDNETELINLEKNINQLEKEEFIFDLLKNNYPVIEELEKLKLKLKQQEKDVSQDFSSEKLNKAINYKEDLTDLEKQLTAKKSQLNNFTGDISALKSTLLTNKSSVRSFLNRQEVREEKLSQILQNENKLKQEFNDLKIKLQDLNTNWTDPLLELTKIELDLINQQQLKSKLTLHKNLADQLQELQQENSIKQERLEVLQKQLLDFAGGDKKSILRNTYLLLLITTLIGAGGFLTNFYLLSYFSLLLFFLIFIYYNSNYKEIINKEKIISDWKLEQSDLQHRITKIEHEVDQITANINKVEADLEQFNLKLGLKENESFALLPEYFNQLQDLKHKNKNLKLEKMELRTKKAEITAELNDFAKKLSQIDQQLNFSLFDNYSASRKPSLSQEQTELYKAAVSCKDLILLAEEYEQLLVRKENLVTDIIKMLGDSTAKKNLKADLDNYLLNLQLTEQYLKLKTDYEHKKQQLEHTLTASDKIKDFLNDIQISQSNETDEDLLFSQETAYQKFIAIFYNYSSATAVNKKYEECSQELAICKQKKKDLADKITTLRNKLTELADSAAIETAQQELNQARNDLKKLAEQYALNKSIYFLLNKLRSQMITKAEKELLEPAANILARITDNEYQAIATGAELDATEFKTTLADGTVQASVNNLSRGTLEQLFLAVRISRIKEISPALPIILDDSFVNFDRSHLYHTAEIISELAVDHQIFILTCHPHLIKFIQKITNQVQYWQLEKGQFNLSKPEALIKHLSYSD